MGRRCVEDREISRLTLICRRAPQARGWIGPLRRGCDQQEQADGRHPQSGDVSNSAPGDLLSECVKSVSAHRPAEDLCPPGALPTPVVTASNLCKVLKKRKNIKSAAGVFRNSFAVTTRFAP